MSDNKNDKLKKLIELMVRQTVKEVLPGMIKQTIVQMLGEGIQQPARPAGNGHKRQALQEASGRPEDFEAYPTMGQQGSFDRAAFRAQFGMEDMGTIGGGQSIPVHTGPITAPAITEHGMAVPVEVPDHLLKAMNTNYSGFLKKMGEHKQNG
jgi:hypothetical protein